MTPVKSNVVLRCVAYGGTYGGQLTMALNEAGLQKLAQVGGSALPSGMYIPPDTTCVFEAEYMPAAPSDAENDIVASATIVGDFLNDAHTDSSSFTSIRVGLSAVYDAPENHNPSRHVYGVGEKVRIDFVPTPAELRVQVVKADINDLVTEYDTFAGAADVQEPSTITYTCPATGTVPNISISYSGIEYFPQMAIVEPQLIVTREASGIGVFFPGQVGMGLLTTKNYIGPFFVSFQGVKVAEIPCTNAIPPK